MFCRRGWQAAPPPGLFQGPVGLWGAKAQGRGLLIICHQLQDANSFCLIPLGVVTPDASGPAEHTELSGGAGRGLHEGTVQPSPWGLASRLGFYLKQHTDTCSQGPCQLLFPFLVWGDFLSCCFQRFSNLFSPIWNAWQAKWQSQNGEGSSVSRDLLKLQNSR